MSAALEVQTNPPHLRCRHATVEEYTAFLRATAASWETVQHRLRQRARFVARYEDLTAWTRAPLTERIGRLWGETPTAPSCRVAYEARPYLLFLGLAGSLRYDWAWLLATRRLDVWRLLEQCGVADDLPALVADAVAHGYEQRNAAASLRWVLGRLFLHLGPLPVAVLTDAHLAAMVAGVDRFASHPDVAAFYGEATRYVAQASLYRAAIHVLGVVLYHRGQVHTEPHRQVPPRTPTPPAPPRLQAIITRFLQERRLTETAASVAHNAQHLRRFTTWLAATYPALESFAELSRDHALRFATELETAPHPRTGQPLAVNTRLGILTSLTVFFRHIATWESTEVPERPLLGWGDRPKRPQRVPRYIPEHELAPIMTAVRALQDPYGRTALLVARWSGARRDEIRRLAFDCLDTYADGTPRLRIPAGKTYRERMIPLNAEAATAIQALQVCRPTERGFRDRKTGVVTRYLFVRRGKLLSDHSLFSTSLLVVCEQAGILTAEDKATVTAHRFRHTVGKQLAEHGAKLRTIMSVLGHASATMSMVYAHISDPEVLRDYQAVLGPGATIAGPFAAHLRAGEVSAATVEWLKANFFQSELELGRCCRLPQEGPCECDLYLYCAKFVTTPTYAPRLRQRRQTEFGLIADAQSRGWTREVERHRQTVVRLEQLLRELGEPIALPGESGVSLPGLTRCGAPGLRAADPAGARIRMRPWDAGSQEDELGGT